MPSRRFHRVPVRRRRSASRKLEEYLHLVCNMERGYAGRTGYGERVRHGRRLAEILRGLWAACDLKVLKGRLLRGVTVLAAGSVVSQVIVALAAPVVARLYTPSDYGVATVYGSVLSMAALIACAR